MKKFLSLFLILPLLVSCNWVHAKVTSIIKDKKYYTTTVVIYNGHGFIPMIQHHYEFKFNEKKEYTHNVSNKDYNNYNIGDTYTFSIHDSKEYIEQFFYTEHIQYQ